MAPTESPIMTTLQNKTLLAIVAVVAAYIGFMATFHLSPQAAYFIGLITGGITTVRLTQYYRHYTGIE